MSTTQRAMQPIVRGVSIVSKVEDVHLHHAVVSKEELAEVGVDLCLPGTRRIPSDDSVVQVQGVA